MNLPILQMRLLRSGEVTPCPGHTANEKQRQEWSQHSFIIQPSAFQLGSEKGDGSACPWAPLQLGCGGHVQPAPT